jgi:hypothetical protein
VRARGIGWLVGVLCLVVGLPAAAVAARTVVLTGEPVVVRLQPLQPVAVTFPEAIASVPTGADPNALSLELDSSRLFVQALGKDVRGLLFVVGVSGRLYPLRYLVATPADTEVVVVRPERPPASAAPGAPEPAPGLTVRTLLAAMLQGRALAGVTESPDDQILLETEALRIVTTRVYIAGPLLGYIAEARNLSEAPLPLRLPEYYAPGLKAAAALAEVIPAKGTTRLYLVFQPGVSY